MAARVEKKDWGAKDGGGMFSEISTLRPNEYPFMISAEDIHGHNGIAADETSEYKGSKPSLTQASLKSVA